LSALLDWTCLACVNVGVLESTLTGSLLKCKLLVSEKGSHLPGRSTARFMIPLDPFLLT